MNAIFRGGRGLRRGAALLAACIAAVTLLFSMSCAAEHKSGFQERLAALEAVVLSAQVQPLAADADPDYAVFLSLCDRRSRAAVFTGTGDTLSAAWEAAAGAANRHARSGGYNYQWIKADVVKETDWITSESLEGLLAFAKPNYFRKGIALDRGFDTALLEAELSANSLLDYKGNTLDLERMGSYLSARGQQAPDGLPGRVMLFSCLGWFSDERGSIHPLYSDDLRYGRRVTEEVDDKLAKQVITTASRFLVTQVKDDGEFIYGFYPNGERDIGSYNILRHSGTIWSLICQYRLTGDETLRATIDSTVDNLVQGYVEYQNDTTAYIVERKSGEIKLGGNALALVALTNYMEEFGTDEYRDLCVALGEGILQMMDRDTGTYYHVLEFPGFARSEEYRTIYYDGEATFALARLYGITRDKKWLDAAEAAMGNFIREDYVQYSDHWVSYAVNEVTKHAPKEEYFTLGLRNAGENMDKIYRTQTTSHTSLELLMAAFELYDRILTEGHRVDYLRRFDEEAMFATIRHRADYMLVGYGWPEYVMYMADPAQVEGTFFTRQDFFRVRIDDVQHFVGGYYAFYVNYDKLAGYAGW